MINITYAPPDADIAERIQQDLAAEPLTLTNHFLLVLVSPESSGEKTVNKAIEDALAEEHRVVPVLLRDAPLPESIQHLKPLDMRRGYRRDRLVSYIRRADIEPPLVRRNRVYLLGFLALVILVFAVSVVAIAGDIVDFPVDEYATENAARETQIQQLVEPTLEGFQPRSTEDARNFPATVDAAPTRIQPFLAGTATALPTSRQATLDAQATAAGATATARADRTDAEAATATPEPDTDG